MDVLARKVQETHDIKVKEEIDDHLAAELVKLDKRCKFVLS